MISFLVKVDRFGILEEIFWSDPVWLISEAQHSIFSIFPDDHVEHLKENFKSSLLSDRPVCSQEKHPIKGLDVSIQCHLAVIQEHVLVFGHNGASGDYPIDRFMIAVLEQSIRSQFGDSSTTNHFEQIQMLNNELMNTHRKLQKANAQQKRLNEDLNNRLVKDSLTGLVSRYQYRSEMESTIAKAPHGIGMFCFIDIDNFKGINDTYGHAIGDEYLIEFAKRLRSIPSESATIPIRIAGDEFGLYIHDIKTDRKTFSDTLWENFKNSVTSTPIATTCGNLPISCSLGMAFYALDANDIYTLIDYADFAMYKAKQAGKATFMLFDPIEYKEAKDRQ